MHAACFTRENVLLNSPVTPIELYFGILNPAVANTVEIMNGWPGGTG